MNIATRTGLQAQSNQIIPSVPDQIAFHDHIACEWELKYKKPSFQTRQTAFNECLPSVIQGKWLDAGCWTGYFGRWLAQRGVEVHFVDNSPEMISVATQLRQNASPDHRTHTPQLAEMESLPF
jgi:2-polyprenyl-3-methyl-5-hydroxy-6-metoxy-1,4-benzoquinol methylase